MNNIFIIVGPTSSGKTSLSIELCKKYNGEIFSADSRQIYKYMDIGTGKVPVVVSSDFIRGEGVWNIKGVNVWCYDLVAPDEFFSSYEYAKYSLPKIRETIELKKNVFVVGGTGFYIDTLTGGVKPSFVEPDFDLRKGLEKLSAQELLSRIMAIDPTSIKNIDVHNPPRLIRVLERLLSKKTVKEELPYIENTAFHYIGLDSSREVLYSRSDSWSEQVWKNGLVEETKKLMEMGYRNTQRMNGLVYKSVLSYLDGFIAEKEAIQRIKFDIHGYIRRQQTYFRKNSGITWFDISKEKYRENIYNFVEEKIKNG